jgi:hypothetical protein
MMYIDSLHLKIYLGIMKNDDIENELISYKNQGLGKIAILARDAPGSINIT